MQRGRPPCPGSCWGWGGLRVFHRGRDRSYATVLSNFWQNRRIRSISATMENKQPPTQAFLLPQLGEAPPKPPPAQEHVTAPSLEEEGAHLHEVQVLLGSHRRQIHGEHHQQAAALGRLRAHVAVQQPTTQQAAPWVGKKGSACYLPSSLPFLQKWVGEIAVS